MLVAATVAATVVFGAVGARAQEQPTAIDEADWQGVLGVRAPVSTAAALRRPPVAAVARRPRAGERRGGDGGGDGLVDDIGGRAAGAVSRATRRQSARASLPEYRYTKVVNGFSARLDPTSLALLDRDREVTGIFPVRIAYPAQAVRSEDSGVLPAAVADLEVAGLDGSGVTVALLDTGVDPRIRISDNACSPASMS